MTARTTAARASIPRANKGAAPRKAQVLSASSGTGVPGSALAKLQEKVRNGEVTAPDQKVPAVRKEPESAPVFFDHEAMTQNLARRRRRKLGVVLARMTCLIAAPVVATYIWFAEYATPFFASEAEFVVQKSEGSQPAMGGMMGAAAGLAGGSGQDAIMLQSFLTSRDAMDMLEKDHGFVATFSSDEIDAWHRLAPDAPREDAFELYEKMVRVGYDPTEGVVHLEVLSPDPETSQAYATSLIGYAEERIDSMTLRMREHQMSEAAVGYAQAEEGLRIAQDKVIALQEAYSVLPPDAEAGVLSGRMGELEAQLVEARIKVAEMERLKSPNETVLRIAQERVADFERELERVRADVVGSTNGGPTQAAIQGEIALAQGEVEARLAILGQSAQQMEMARLEASKQMRFLSVSVFPGMTDVAAYPEVWKNTGLAFLAIAGLYMAISLMGTVLREQVNS
ncbi:MAG: hypothetical protein ABJN42_07865 [Roseibium sp.]|uniref:hypothetical protein n=1 Tax=Roseibium sp. TaxID=1936156 RepID=UPI0032986D60